MPELPDLLSIQHYLRTHVRNQSISSAEVKNPIVLRVAVEGTFEDLMRDKSVQDCHVHGPFLRLECSGKIDLVINLMLAGKLQHQQQHEKTVGHLCFSLLLKDGSRLNLCDEQKMAKAYVVRQGEYAAIPKYREQGVDIMSSGFTLPAFIELAGRHTRKQVRVFLNDHTILSSIGNAYADEILFDAQIHPKTFVSKLTQQQIERLHQSILSVMKWGIEQVNTASQPIHIKVRDHMKVRNKKDQPCPRCGTKIRREGVRGYDVFFCPKCQSPTRKSFIDWNPA